MKKSLITFCYIIVVTSVLAQDSAKILKEGDKAPEFYFSELSNTKVKKVDNKSFLGKWLILDFWSKSCTSCILSFKKYNSYLQRHLDSLNILLIGYNSNASNTEIRSLYDQLCKKQHLVIPVAWDTSLFNKLHGVSVPLVILINPSGVVKAIANELSEIDLDNLINGQIAKYEKYIFQGQEPSADYLDNLPILTSGKQANGGSDTGFTYRTLFCRWNETMPKYNISVKQGVYEIFEADLITLYRLAYFGKDVWNMKDTSLYGKVNYSPVILSKDSLLFKRDNNPGHNRYCFSVIFPTHNYYQPLKAPMQRQKFNQILKTTLDNIFNYTISFENRTSPAYIIWADSGAYEKLKSKGGPTFRQCTYNSILANNVSSSDLIDLLMSRISAEFDFPIINNLKSIGNIDLVLNCDTSDIEELKIALKLQGLNLIRFEKEMKTMVISDKE